MAQASGGEAAALDATVVTEDNRPPVDPVVRAEILLEEAEYLVERLQRKVDKAKVQYDDAKIALAEAKDGVKTAKTELTDARKGGQE